MPYKNTFPDYLFFSNFAPMRLFRNIRYISLAKIWNLCHLQAYYRKAKHGNFSTEVPPPSFASYEPTNICNLACEMCPSGKGQLKRPRGTADMELYRKFILENRKTLTNIILHFQGEPLMCQQLDEMIAFARQNRIYTMFSTNGQLLAQYIDLIRNARPDHIIVSLDGLTDETYTKYRVGGKVQNVFYGLEKLSQLPAKERPYIELQFLVFSHNEHEIPEDYTQIGTNLRKFASRISARKPKVLTLCSDRKRKFSTKKGIKELLQALDFRNCSLLRRTGCTMLLRQGRRPRTWQYCQPKPA